MIKKSIPKKPAGAGKKIEHASRVVEILQVVGSRPAGARIGRMDLAVAVGRSVRTIARDVIVIRKAGVHLDYDSHTRTYALHEEGWVRALQRMTPADVMALALARSYLASPTTPYAHTVQAALTRATAGLSPELLALLDRQARKLQAEGGARDYSTAPFAGLLDAATRQDQVEIDYESRSGGDRAWRTVDPYVLAERDGGYLEMHAWCHRNQGIRTFALDRVYGLRPTGQRFTLRMAEWEEFQNARGIVGGLRGGLDIPVEVRFDPEVALFARDHRWPETLTVSLQPDGSLILTGTAMGVEGILRELLRWRRHACVLGGPELRTRMIEEVRAMAARYE